VWLFLDRTENKNESMGWICGCSPRKCWNLIPKCKACPDLLSEREVDGDDDDDNLHDAEIFSG
jgi:hypothetical protein